MSSIYVAQSKALNEWGSDVGLSKNLFKFGLTDQPPKEAVAALNAEKFAGQTDWTLVKAEPAENADEAALIEHLAQKEKIVDPKYYPRIRGATGIFKVKLENVENHIIIKMSLAGEEPKLGKLKPADIAGYLIHNALN
ncbi:hypothetical protein FRZ61_27480 [Hypericibacter adhaerens]|jgi:hypothetical protein|uniref:Uncharacterized protein n=1 Tax=Hypericibacter adhaerens TaxID=2602016 RepID=A0A5J6N729_9PROT|nr:hypothetical protein [Hypericibacter adhaerens]QEX22816.1 hypothetical protein FRZ61_27480 [Hypericibacter adhaerens]